VALELHHGVEVGLDGFRGLVGRAQGALEAAGELHDRYAGVRRSGYASARLRPWHRPRRVVRSEAGAQAELCALGALCSTGRSGRAAESPYTARDSRPG